MLHLFSFPLRTLCNRHALLMPWQAVDSLRAFQAVTSAFQLGHPSRHP